MIFILSNSLTSQNSSNEKTFEDLEQNLYKTLIIKVDSMNIAELKNKYKNVVSILFLNLEKIIVSETEDQIVMNYVLTTKSKPSTSWNVRLITQFRDNRLRLRIYDFGNVFIPSGKYTRTWDTNSLTVHNNKRAQKRFRAAILNEWMNKNDVLVEAIEKGMTKPSENEKW